MTREELVEEIRRLPLEQRVELLEVISRSVREDWGAGEGTPADAADEADEADEHADRLSAVRRLRGALKFDGPPPSDEEVKEIITDYLSEKYS